MRKINVIFVIAFSLFVGVTPLYGAEMKEENSVIDNLYAGIFSEIYNNNLNAHIESTNIDKVGASEYLIGYATTNVNIHNAPFVEAEVMGVLEFNGEIAYYYTYNDEGVWCTIDYGDNIGYIKSDFITNNKEQYYNINITNSSSFKSYMQYKSITDKSSKQYILQNNHAYTGDYGIRMINGRYCIAVGTGISSSVGAYIDLVLENENIIPCIISDIKDNKHTDSNNIVTVSNNCVSEFIVDYSNLISEVKISGDISSCCEEWASPVVEFRIYEKNILE